MAKEKIMRLSQVARKLNVGTSTILTFLIKKGFQVDNKPNVKITLEQFNLVAKEFSAATLDKEEAAELTIGKNYTHNPILAADAVVPHYTATIPKLPGVKSLGKVALQQPSKPTEKEKTPVLKESKPVPPHPVEAPATVSKTPQTTKKISLKMPARLQGLTVLGKVTLAEPVEKQFRQVASSDVKSANKPKARKRIPTKSAKTITPSPSSKTRLEKEKDGVSAKEIQEQIKNTLARLNSSKKTEINRAKYRKEKRSAVAKAQEAQLLRAKEAAKLLQVTEFISANELASLMNVPVNKVLSTCMELGMVTSINQRLDAEAITVIADELGYNVEFVDVAAKEIIEAPQDKPEDLVERAPIVTIMGHVDHGKTSLIDYIRKTKVATQEAGGITQHIGAYEVITENGKRITFLDTPGHEAFTAMRTRGAKVTDIAIIVVAADDSVKPQTKEAINHAKMAGVSIIIAINKIDKPGANPAKVKEDLAKHNILVEEWGGKYQSQTVSAKTGQGVNELLEKILFEAELLALKANPTKKAQGTVLEACLDQGKGYVVTTMIQDGTLRIGDVMLAGVHYGKVKAMFDYQGRPVKTVVPSTPVQLLGLGGAPQAGDSFRIVATIQEAYEIASKRQQILREQNLRTKKHITLGELGRRLAIGNFKELNLILKGDVDGSVEALADALLQLSNEEINLNIIHKGVGAISESDILLASSADAIVIGFQIRPAANVRKLAEKEGIEIRLYSIIYDVVNSIKDAIKGMLAPSVEEVITGNASVKKLFKIAKLGTIAGCYVTDGYIHHANPIRLIRAGTVIHTGTIVKLKHLKEELKKAKAGFECGISIKNFNDIKEEDVIEGFETKEIVRTL